MENIRPVSLQPVSRAAQGSGTQRECRKSRIASPSIARIGSCSVSHKTHTRPTGLAHQRAHYRHTCRTPPARPPGSSVSDRNRPTSECDLRSSRATATPRIPDGPSLLRVNSPDGLVRKGCLRRRRRWSRQRLCAGALAVPPDPPPVQSSVSTWPLTLLNTTAHSPNPCHYRLQRLHH